MVEKFGLSTIIAMYLLNIGKGKRGIIKSLSCQLSDEKANGMYHPQKMTAAQAMPIYQLQMQQKKGQQN